jgi:hypothetical protein
LRTKLEAFARRKRLRRQFVNTDEKIVGALPRHKRVVSKIVHASSDYNARAAHWPLVSALIFEDWL